MEILEYYSPTDIIAIEQFYLDTLKPEYNIAKKASWYNDEKSQLKTRQTFSVEVLDSETNQTSVFKTLTAASKFIGCDIGTLRENEERSLRINVKQKNY